MRSNYDFSVFTDCMKDIKNNVNSETLNDIKKELNNFFNDSVCREVLYTKNIDKLFFGMRVIPYINDSLTEDIIGTDKPIRIKEYYLEIDSKLFDPILDLTPDEAVAVLLHEVGHIVNSSSAIDEFRKAFDMMLADMNDNISIVDSVNYKELLLFGIRDSIVKMQSLFYKDMSEFEADQFCFYNGYGEELQSAMKKICKNSYNINKNVDNRLIVMRFVLKLYKDVKHRRLDALRNLNKGIKLSPSTLEKREINNVIRRLNRISNPIMMESKSLIDSFKIKLKAEKYRSINSLAYELYEYRIRIKNVSDEDDALYILRQLNTRIAILDDYINTDITDEDTRLKEKWIDILDQYRDARAELVKKSVYKNNYSAIVVQYPNIQQDNY